ncbi:hypothetical protein D3C72_2260760 [compost metagenome]
MGIMEAVREQILDEGIEKGIKTGIEKGRQEERAHKSFEFVERLIEKSGWSDEQIADVASVSVAYVNEVRKELASRK